MPACTTSSVRVSIDEVASSRISTGDATRDVGTALLDVRVALVGEFLHESVGLRELTDEELTQRRAELEAGDGYVAHRDRKVSQALKAYAAFARSADKGATRDPELINKLSGLA